MKIFYQNSVFSFFQNGCAGTHFFHKKEIKAHEHFFHKNHILPNLNFFYAHNFFAHFFLQFFLLFLGNIFYYFTIIFSLNIILILNLTKSPLLKKLTNTSVTVSLSYLRHSEIQLTNRYIGIARSWWWFSVFTLLSWLMNCGWETEWERAGEKLREHWETERLFADICVRNKRVSDWTIIKLDCAVNIYYFSHIQSYRFSKILIFWKTCIYIFEKL